MEYATNDPQKSYKPGIDDHVSDEISKGDPATWSTIYPQPASETDRYVAKQIRKGRCCNDHLGGLTKCA